VTPTDEQISPYYSKAKRDLICDLLGDKKYIDQIMISNNINFKVQLKKYGGFGYANIFVNYRNKIIDRVGLTEEEVRKVFRENILNLLAWWEPPKKQEKRVDMITCSL
jgi:predicted metal-dependent phosphotriesterase family hydrolase